MNKQIYRDIALVAIGGALSLVAYKLFSKLTRKHRTKAENDKFQQSNEIIQEVFYIDPDSCVFAIFHRKESL